MLVAQARTRARTRYPLIGRGGAACKAAKGPVALFRSLPFPTMQSLKKIAPMAFAGARNASTLRKVRRAPAHLRNWRSRRSPPPQVCVIGAAGGIGQPLGLLMKMVRVLTVSRAG